MNEEPVAVGLEHPDGPFIGETVLYLAPTLLCVDRRTEVGTVITLSAEELGQLLGVSKSRCDESSREGEDRGERDDVMDATRHVSVDKVTTTPAP